MSISLDRSAEVEQNIELTQQTNQQTGGRRDRELQCALEQQVFSAGRWFSPVADRRPFFERVTKSVASVSIDCCLRAKNGFPITLKTALVIFRLRKLVHSNGSVL